MYYLKQTLDTGRFFEGARVIKEYFWTDHGWADRETADGIGVKTWVRKHAAEKKFVERRQIEAIEGRIKIEILEK